MCRLKWKMKIASGGLWKCRRLKNASLKCYQSCEHDRTHWSYQAKCPFDMDHVLVNSLSLCVILWSISLKLLRFCTYFMQGNLESSRQLNFELSACLYSKSYTTMQSFSASCYQTKATSWWQGRGTTVLVGNLFDLEWNLSSRLRLLGFRKKVDLISTALSME